MYDAAATGPGVSRVSCVAPNGLLRAEVPDAPGRGRPAGSRPGQRVLDSAPIRSRAVCSSGAKALVKAEIAATARDVELRRKQLGDSFQAMRTQAEDTARIAEAAYREGGADLLRLLDAQRVRIETQLFYQRALSLIHI